METQPASTKNQIPRIGTSEAIRRVYDLIEKVADSDSTILLTGESGTGKEVIAKAIHSQSPRAKHPFIPINCGAIPETLLESELFGHEKGAFTGAAAVRQGRFELADGGTLFFDEIGEMPYPLQVKLLRAIQEREFERVGGSRSIHVNVRILAATNVDLEQAVLEKKFRKDLFYRLNVIPMMLPPLRERKEDIPLLMSHFLDRFNEKNHKTVALSGEAANLLIAYPWPGNIRELENMMERMVLLAFGDVLSPSDLPDKIRLWTSREPGPFFRDEEEKPFWAVASKKSSFVESALADRTVSSPLETQGAPASERWDGTISDEGIDFEKLVEAFENQLIQEALKKANGVKNKAAQLLHMNRTTLVEKLKRRNKEAPSPFCA